MPIPAKVIQQIVTKLPAVFDGTYAFSAKEDMRGVDNDYEGFRITVQRISPHTFDKMGDLCKEFGLQVGISSFEGKTLITFVPRQAPGQAGGDLAPAGTQGNTDVEEPWLNLLLSNRFKTTFIVRLPATSRAFSRIFTRQTLPLLNDSIHLHEADWAVVLEYLYVRCGVSRPDFQVPFSPVYQGLKVHHREYAQEGSVFLYVENDFSLEKLALGNALIDAVTQPA
jgi:hypothetical protein